MILNNLSETLWLELCKNFGYLAKNLLTGAAWWGAGEARAAGAYCGESGHVHALASRGKTRLSSGCSG